MKLLRAAAVAAIALASTAHAQGKSQAKGDMTFFVTSVGGGNGASLGGLDGADKHCNELAKAAGSKHDNWHAYLSTTAPGGEAGVNARDRIGKGPWRNSKGVVVAKNVADLHSDKNNINKDTALTEKGERQSRAVPRRTTASVSTTTSLLVALPRSVRRSRSSSSSPACIR